jgi:hypothetical protein
MSDPLLGINAPVRLLREQWQSPTALAQELYAMFTQKGPREIHDTLTIRVGAGQPALRIIQQDSETTINEGATHNFGVTKGETSTAPAVPGRKPRPRPQDEPARRRGGFSEDDTPSRPRRPDDAPGGTVAASSLTSSPAVEFDVPTRFSGPAVFDKPIFTAPPLFVNPNTGQSRTLEDLVAESLGHKRNPKMDRSIAGSQGTAAYFGVVQDGIGSTWSVTLFDDPGAQTPGDTVSVSIPYIDEGEAAPVGVTVGPIFLIGGSYYYQPPVWLE